MRTWNFSKKDVINAYTTKALQDLKGQVIKVTGIALTEGLDNDTNEKRDVALFKTVEGDILSSISGTVIRMVPDVMDYAEEEDLEVVEIKVESGVSKEGNEFIILRLV